MNKKLAIVAGLLVAMCSGLFAQQAVTMHANIPFDFRMGDKLVPSGTYRIEASGSAIMLREMDGRIVAVSFLTIPESRTAPAAKGELLFHRYGDEFFLASVWAQDSSNGRSLPKTKQEKQLAGLVGGSFQTAAIRVK